MMRDREILWQSNDRSTYSKDNPKEKVIVLKRTVNVPTEFEICYQRWGMTENGGLDVPIRVFISKHGLLVCDKLPHFNGHEINLTWEQIDNMREELGVPFPLS